MCCIIRRQEINLANKDHEVSLKSDCCGLIIGWAMKRTFREFLQPDSFQNIFPIKVLLQQKTISCIRNRFFI